MNPPKDKGRAAGDRATLKNQLINYTDFTLPQRLALALWISAYALEDSRESHATRRQYVRSALCAVALAVLRVLS